MKNIESFVKRDNVYNKLLDYVRTPLNEIKEDDDNADLLKGLRYYEDAMNCSDAQKKEALKKAKEHLEKYKEKPLCPVFEDVVYSVLNEIQNIFDE